jgi:regulator of sigma E protease
VSREHFSSSKTLGWKILIAPTLGQVSAGSPADKAGLLSNDRVLEINNQKISDWSQISPLIQKLKGTAVKLSVQRQNSVIPFTIKPRWNSGKKYWVVGISSQTVHVSESFSDALSLGMTQVYDITVKTFDFIFRLVQGQESTKSMGGPIMIAQMVGQAAQSDISSLLFLVGFISLQFAIFNILPIPALDGGHIFFLALEKIKGGALPKGFRVSVQKAGFSLLLLLILYISVQDGMKLFQGM